MTHKLASFISGGGSTMEYIGKRCGKKESEDGLDLTLACVISSTRKAVKGMERAMALGVSPENILVIPPKRFAGADGVIDEIAFGNAINIQLEKRGISVVTLNGYLAKIPANVIEPRQKAIFNQHPGPLPDFGGDKMYGKRVHAAVLYFAKRYQGVMPFTHAIAQRVHPEYDKGAIVGREYVSIHHSDTPEELANRVLPSEYKGQVSLLRSFIKGELKELPRESVVPEDEAPLLEEAKAYGISTYPHG
jgi:folate-dependent phosphoribosylglycinamide formyltransferase PurN